MWDIKAFNPPAGEPPASVNLNHVGYKGGYPQGLAVAGLF